MPMYDYRCGLCGAQFEVRQSFSDDTLSVCPPDGGPAACESPGEGAVKKVFSGVGIAFKGDGFYKNDHGANAKHRRREREAAKAKAEDSPPGSSSEKGSSSAAKDSSKGSSSSPKSGSSSPRSGSSTSKSRPTSSSSGSPSPSRARAAAASSSSSR